MTSVLSKITPSAILLAATLFALTPTARAQSAQPTDWRESYSYTLGVQAYVYGFPWVYLPQLRWLWVTQPTDLEHTPYAPINQFWHARSLASAEYRSGGSPNNDTLYSMAWLDVSNEPLILTVPEVGERYYTMEIASMDSDNFAYVGKRTTGTKAGHYAIVGPGWQGTLPDGVKALPASRTPWVLVLGRTLVDGPNDLAAVHAIQDRYRLTPLGLWSKPDVKVADNRNVWRPFDGKADPLADWKTMNRAMTEKPPGGSACLVAEALLFHRRGAGAGRRFPGRGNEARPYPRGSRRPRTSSGCGRGWRELKGGKRLALPAAGHGARRPRRRFPDTRSHPVPRRHHLERPCGGSLPQYRTRSGEQTSERRKTLRHAFCGGRGAESGRLLVNHDVWR